MTTTTRKAIRRETRNDGEPCILMSRYDAQVECWVVKEIQAGYPDYHHGCFDTKRQARNFINETCDTMDAEATVAEAECKAQRLRDEIAGLLENVSRLDSLEGLLKSVKRLAE